MAQVAARLPVWLRAIAETARAPQKSPPVHGAPRVDRWAIPQELRTHRAWACWRYEQDSSGRWSKPPYQPDGTRAEPSDDSTWSEFDECFEAYRQALIPTDLHAGSSKRSYDGVSFGLSPRWGIVGVDLDHISEWLASATRIVETLDSYSETTPSGDGVRIFCKGTLPEGRRRRGNVEMYVQRRFLTVTGQHLPATPKTITSHPRELYAVWQRWLERER